MWAVIALLCKEDVALTLGAMALVLAWREKERKLLIPAVVTAAWFALMTRVVMPAANSGLDPFYVAEFNHLGANLREIVVNSVLHPSRWASRLLEARGPDGPYLLQLIGPFGIVMPLLALPELFLVVPQFFINSVTLYPFAADARYHYSALPVAALTICTIEVVGRLDTRSWRRAAVAGVLGAAVITNIWWAPSPLGALEEYVPGIDSVGRGDPMSGVWRRRPHAHQTAAEKAFALIPPDAPVSASFHLVPQLTHRREIYQFPTPFMRGDYRVPGSAPPDPATVEYVIVDTGTFVPELERLYLALIQPQSGFESLYHEDSIALLKRSVEPLSDLVRSFAPIGL